MPQICGFCAGVISVVESCFKVQLCLMSQCTWKLKKECTWDGCIEIVFIVSCCLLLLFTCLFLLFASCLSWQSGERVGVMRTQDGLLMVYINGRQVGVAATDLPPRLYGIVDLYGQCSEVKITSASSNSSSIVDPTSVDMRTLLQFHTLCGGNAQISKDRLTASRMPRYEEFTKLP